MSEMTCQKFHHVGQIFPFPAGWANATGAVQCLDGVAYINGTGYSISGIRASVARKQSFLSSLELGLLMSIGMRLPASAEVDEDFDFSPYARDLHPVLATPAGRAALVEQRRMMTTGILQTIIGFLSLMKSVVTHGLFDYYPPGNVSLSATYTVLNADFTLYSDQSAVDDLLDGFSVYQAGLGYAGFEDFSTWPVFEDGAPAPARLLLWTAIDTFLGGLGITGHIRSYLGMSSPWGSLSDMSALMSDLGLLNPELPPKLADLHPRRLASLMQAFYEHTLSRIGSQEVVLNQYARIPHYEATLEATLIIQADYASGDSPGSPSGASAPTFSIHTKYMDVTSEAIENTYELSYKFDIQAADTLDLNPLADNFVCDPSIASADFTGRGTINGKDGATWLELTTNDLIAVAMDDPGTYNPHWTKRGQSVQGGSILQASFVYRTPFENAAAAYFIHENPAVATDSYPCAALRWLIASQTFCSFLAKGSIASSGTHLGNDEFMASAGMTNQSELNIIRRLMLKVSDGVADGNGWFGQQNIDIGWLIRQFSFESDQSILAQLSNAQSSWSVTEAYSRYRLPISGCSWTGLQALHDPGNETWGPPGYLESGELILLGEEFNASGVTLDWLRPPSWISQDVMANNPGLSARADLLGVASYESVPYGTAQTNQ